ncbi:MAG: DUF302 domain-containing protein, partial [Pseudomonadota bacterium]
GAFALIIVAATAQADDGLVLKKSANDFATTLSTLQAQIDARGLTTFAVVDHAAGAKQAGAELRPTTLVIFGSPKLGTPLLAIGQTAGLDLPMRVLVYEDAEGEAWVSYWPPMQIAMTHGIPADLEAIGTMTNGLASITDRAIGKEPIEQ